MKEVNSFKYKYNKLINKNKYIGLKKHEDFLVKNQKQKKLHIYNLLKVNSYLFTRKIYKGSLKYLNRHNDYILNNMLEENKIYFNNMFKKIDKYIKLDYNQRKAILINDDNLLIIAGAGCGKTTTMAGKVKYLIDKCNMKEDKILVLSFTNKATEEIKDRIVNQFGYKKVNISTFHKLGIKILKENNINFNIISDEEKYQIVNSYIENNIPINEFNKLFFDKNIVSKKSKKEKIERLIIPFIQILKSKNYQLNDFKKIIIKQNQKEQKQLLMIEKIYIHYNEQLKNYSKIDFEDMINIAYNKLNKKNTKFKYEYIIIDEYQDISLQRYNLIKKMVDLFNSKIMAVGDDWQSIFSFAGSEINLFTEFKKYFNYSKTITIDNTYRNSQELLDTASTFIHKNKNQIIKKLKSNKKINKPIEVYVYKDSESIIKEHLVEKIILEIYKNYPKGNILLMGRYKTDIDFLLKNKKFAKTNQKITYKTIPSIQIDFLTIHSSKGLGYDNCILLNASNNELGFPSLIKDNNLISLINKKSNEGILYPEERRLFYVALTRTKNKIYILAPHNKMSPFLKEIIKNKNVLKHKKIQKD